MTQTSNILPLYHNKQCYYDTVTKSKEVAMTRGGYREKAGRKSTWVSGCKFEETKLIRVPIAISDRVLEIAHKLVRSRKIFYFSLALLLNSDGLILLGFFQTPTRDRP